MAILVSPETKEFLTIWMSGASIQFALCIEKNTGR
jgi:hypothetical protein